jgi:GTP-binding protein
MAAYTEKMLETWEEMPPYFFTSASDSTGRDEVLNYIDELNKNLTGL